MVAFAVGVNFWPPPPCISEDQKILEDDINKGLFVCWRFEYPTLLDRGVHGLVKLSFRAKTETERNRKNGSIISIGKFLNMRICWVRDWQVSNEGDVRMKGATANVELYEPTTKGLELCVRCNCGHTSERARWTTIHWWQ